MYAYAYYTHCKNTYLLAPFDERKLDYYGRTMMEREKTDWGAPLYMYEIYDDYFITRPLIDRLELPETFIISHLEEEGRNYFNLKELCLANATKTAEELIAHNAEATSFRQIKREFPRHFMFVDDYPELHQRLIQSIYEAEDRIDPDGAAQRWKERKKYRSFVEQYQCVDHVLAKEIRRYEGIWTVSSQAFKQALKQLTSYLNEAARGEDT